MQRRCAVILVGSVLATIVLSNQANAQAQLRGMLTVGMGDIAAIKQNAEAGDAKAQVALADSLIGNFHSADALPWYRKAAEQGNSEGAYQVGRILLYGSPGIPKEQAISPNPAQGILWTFRAATNGHGEACRDMAKAYQNGWGVSADLVHAYAWFKIASESPSSVVAKVELNQLALKLDSNAIGQGSDLADAFRRGNWESPSVVVSSVSSDFKLSGIILGQTPLAIISGKTLAVGGSAKLRIKTGTVAIKCLKIENDSVVVAVEGEAAPRVLRLK